MDYLLILAKAVGFFVTGLVAFRFMGSQSVGRLTDFDLVVVIAVGALIGDVLSNNDTNPFLHLTAIATLVLIQVGTSLLAMKYPSFEKLIMGKPIRLIYKGKLEWNGLRRARLTKNSLDQELRVQGLDSYSTVDQAFMEPNGKLSVLEKTK
jgi:uncharacterized membrane protein YcaP (DUF421 family)